MLHTENSISSFNPFISVTLSKTEKGFAPPVEHIGQPAHVQKEMGMTWSETSRMANVHYPWLKSGYLQERKKQLQKVINELDPHSPVSKTLPDIFLGSRSSGIILV